MLLSVIIPVYNVEHTLERCVQSVLAQDVPGMKIILVDDGATDGSAALCDTYRNKKNVTVIHQDNAGLSAARNTGLTVARGRYVTFVDSDDYLDAGLYASLMKVLQADDDIDLLEYSFIRDDGKSVETHTLHDKCYHDVWRYWFEAKAYLHGFAWNKIFKRTLFDTIRFPVGRKFEDVFVLPQLLGKVRCVHTTPIGFYQYTYNKNGITARAQGNEWKDLLRAHLNVLENTSLQTYEGFGAYYAHVLNVQLHTYELTGDANDIQLPTLPFYGTLKLKLLRLFGMRRLCMLHRGAHQVL